jgi:hypothetical protein
MARAAEPEQGAHRRRAVVGENSIRFYARGAASPGHARASVRVLAFSGTCSRKLAW